MKASAKNYMMWGSARLVFAMWMFGFLVLAAVAQTVSPLNLPLYFEANKDETGFISRGSGYQFLISQAGVQLALRGSDAHPATAQMQFVGANPHAQIHGEAELPGKINYLIGNDSSKWQTGLPTFSRVQATEIYPGINLVFYGNQQQLEYDFAIAPGANPNLIKIHFNGVDKIFLTADGALVLKIGTGEVRQPCPEIYQTVAGARKIIGGGYKMLDAQTVAFEIGNYDRSLPLVIDPVLLFSTFFGGDIGDTGWAIALNTNSFADSSNGYIYIAGQTFSKNFYKTGAVQTNFAGGKFTGDAFVAKFSNPATNLIYLTYLGGSGDDAAFGVAADGNGDAYIAGFTESTNFPVANPLPGHGTISGKFDPNVGSYSADAIVAELDPGGSNLVYSTYLGGESSDSAYGIALDSSTNAYVTGFTYSTNFPVTAGAFQTHLVCSNSFYLNANAFVTEIANGGGALVYSTYLGGTNFDFARSIAVDANNYVYVAGYTLSTNFPVWHVPTNFPTLGSLNGASNLNKRSVADAFVTKFPPLATQPSSLSNLVYSTYLGGTNWDIAYGVAADSSGIAYVTGSTSSTNFPNFNKPPGLSSYLTTNGFANPLLTNAFLTKIAPDGSSIIASAVFGGRGFDIGYGVAVDPEGNAFVVGAETSTNFPTTNTFDFLARTNSGGRDVFVASFNTNWSAMNYSVLIGGKHDDEGFGIALDASDNAFITGKTTSTNFPTQFTIDDITNFELFVTNSSFVGTNIVTGTNFVNGTRLAGTNDAFLAEILFTVPTPTDVTITPPGATNPVGDSVSFTVSGSATIPTPVLFQWQRVTNLLTGAGTNLLDKGDFSGVNFNVLTITNIQTNDAGTYSVIVYYGGTPLTNSVPLVVTQPADIETPLSDQVVELGGDANFALTVFGTPPIRYQWSHNGTNLVNGGNISGANTNNLVFTPAHTNDAGTYTLIATNNFGSVTDSASLAVLTVPTIVTPPANQTNGIGSTVSFTVVATGSGGANGVPLLYAWGTNNVAINDGAHYAGTTTSTLTISNVQTSDSLTNYIVVVYYNTNNIVLRTNALVALLVDPPVSTASITSIVSTNKTWTVAGKGGPTNWTYFVLTSTNLHAPLNSWSPWMTNQFDGSGNFSFTNSNETNPAQYYILKYTNFP